MAKSIRSKWKRKCRAIKRERYGKKELERLKKTLGVTDDSEKPKDENMAELSEIATIKDLKDDSKVAKLRPETTGKEAEDDEMDTSDPKKRVFSTKTLRDQHGSYPVWVHPRKIVKKGRKAKKKGKDKGKGKK